MISLTHIFNEKHFKNVYWMLCWSNRKYYSNASSLVFLIYISFYLKLLLLSYKVFQAVIGVLDWFVARIKNEWIYLFNSKKLHSITVKILFVGFFLCQPFPRDINLLYPGGYEKPLDFYEFIHSPISNTSRLGCIILY